LTEPLSYRNSQILKNRIDKLITPSNNLLRNPILRKTNPIKREPILERPKPIQSLEKDQKNPILRKNLSLKSSIDPDSYREKKPESNPVERNPSNP
jgi:hypothetical protein